MNQSLIIANLNYKVQGQERIMERTLNGFLTTDAMINYGMWACYTCGYINSVDYDHCRCGEEKFILREDFKCLDNSLPVVKVKPIITKVYKTTPLYSVIDLSKPYIVPKKYQRRPIVDSVTGQEYPNLKEAADSLGVSISNMHQMLCGLYKNKTNLKYKAI